MFTGGTIWVLTHVASHEASELPAAAGQLAQQVRQEPLQPAGAGVGNEPFGDSL